MNFQHLTKTKRLLPFEILVIEIWPKPLFFGFGWIALLDLG
jgi:hypothetical protein